MFTIKKHTLGLAILACLCAGSSPAPAATSPLVRHNGVGCSGTGFRLDHFSVKPTNANAVWGYWYAYTDTSAARPKDSATGASTIQGLVPPDPRGFVSTIWPGKGGMAALRATLQKHAPDYHAQAGWAGIGTNWYYDELGENLPVFFPGLKAFSFDFFLGKNIADSLQWDSLHVPYITFKVALDCIGDAQQFQVKIPASLGNGTNICVDLDSLTQPSWFVDQTGGDAWIPENLTHLAWEMKIDDTSDSTIHTSGPNTMAIQNVWMWGLDSAMAAWAVMESTSPPYHVSVSDQPSGQVKFQARASSNYSCPDIAKKGRAQRSGGLIADYHNAVVLSYSLPGASAVVEIVRLDGSKVANLKAPAVARNLSLPVSLARGIYRVIVRGEKQTVSTSLMVAR